MKNLTLITVFTFSFFIAKAQTQDAKLQDTLIYNHVDTQPEYPDGLKALSDYVKKNLKSGDDKGVVFTTFVVEKDGSLSQIKVVKHLSATADKESIRLISSFPKFKPGIKDNKFVRCSFTLPIIFPQAKF